MPNWLADKQELEIRITKGVARPSSPSALRLDEITILDTVFQHRTVSEWASDAHVKALLKGLKNTAGKPFESLTVLWVGDAWALVDGHHRYKAYQEYEFDEPVPVRVFQGSLDEALGEALRANAQDKLTMTAKEKMNAAWRLVIGSELSINKTAELSLASRASVVHMRKVRETLVAKASLGYLGTLDWPAAKAKFEGLDIEIGSGGEWLEKRARLIADQLTKTFGKELSKHPRALWMALDRYDPNLAYAFCEEHGINAEVLGDRYGDEGAFDNEGEPEF